MFEWNYDLIEWKNIIDIAEYCFLSVTSNDCYDIFENFGFLDIDYLFHFSKMGSL